MIEVSAAIGAMIVQVAGALGADPQELERATGFDAALASNADARIPISLETALWDEAARLTGDEAFGLHAAERVRIGAFDVLDYAIRTAPSLRAAFERLARYNRLVHDAAVFSLHEKGELFRIEHSLGAILQSRHAAEFTLASILVVSAQLVGRPLVVRRIEFKHAAPAVSSEHRRAFGCHPEFSSNVNALELASELLELPVLGADPALSRVIQRHADALLAARPLAAEPAATRVRRILMSKLGDGGESIGLSAVARELHMSERSLQRRLADEGAAFDVLLDELRRELAARYLSEPNLSISEIAYLLGYSESSAFHRAFKRWTGKTPSQARERAA